MMLKHDRSDAAHSVGPDLIASERINQTLHQLLVASAIAHPDTPITCYETNGECTSYTHATFKGAVENLAASLSARGLGRGDKLLLQTVGIHETLLISWACFVAGVTAVPMAPVLNFDPNTAQVRRLKSVYAMLDAPLVISSAANAADTARVLGGEVISFDDPMLWIVRDGLFAAPTDPEDIILLPTTSGSTGTPKAVPLTHRNIMAMTFGTIQDNKFGPDDCALNWMPLDHPGALVFLSVVPMAAGAAQVHLPTTTVLGDPLRWLALTQENKASISWAPNFAFAMLTDALKATTKKFDLSSLRFLVSAGEHVAPDILRNLLTEFEKHAFPDGGLRPAFGMAESCSGITWSKGLSRDDLVTQGDVSVVSLGGPIPGAELKITDDDNSILPNGTIGSLQMRGPSVFAAYLNNPEANAKSRLADGWFKTGDYGYLQNGELYVTGRDSETLVINGLNVPPHDIERAAAAVDGISDSDICCFASRAEAGAVEEIVLILATHSDLQLEVTALQKLAAQVRTQVARTVGVRIARFIVMAKSDIPKTSIGKIQRATLKAAFESGDLDDRLIPDPKPQASSGSADPNQSGAERLILSVWGDLLGMDLSDPDTNFFDVGGHSLLLIQGHARLCEAYPSLEIVDLFTHATPASLAKFLDSTGDEAQPEVSRPRAKRANPDRNNQDIAVIGMACRFPGADTIDAFWENLLAKRESITTFSVDELLAAGFDKATVTHPDFVRANPVLNDHKGFDAGLFGYSRREAEMMDPQQRLFLHVAWECLESAGYSAQAANHRIGAYIGSNINTYFLNNVWPNRASLDAQDKMDVYTPFSMGGFQAMVANDKDYIATRTSFKLGMTGPSLNTQTACSTGLVLIHQAVQALRAGECDMIMAGTSSVLSPIANGHLWQEGMIVSQDGHCRAFDRDATGTIFGSGVGAVLLRPLQDALDNGDHIFATIKGTAVNNDGSDKVGFMAPSVAGQKEVAQMALEDAQVAPSSIAFVEAHGTGTQLGDPVEMTSLRAAYQGGDAGMDRFMGSVKTNVGHLQISSGIVGFIKSALAVYHGKIPATLHFSAPNPALKYEDGPFAINTDTVDWPDGGGPRRAGINSLGIGGTNAHVIIEQPPLPLTADAADRPERPGHVVTLHAQSEAELARLAGRLSAWIAGNGTVSPANLAYSMNVGRRRMPVRAALAFETMQKLREQLDGVQGQRGGAVALVLDLTLSQMVSGFGKDVLETSPRFAVIVAAMGVSLFEPRGLPTLGEVMMGAEVPTAHAALYRNAMAMALGQFWLSWGVTNVSFTGDASLSDFAQQAGFSEMAFVESNQVSQGTLIQSLVPEEGHQDLWPFMLEAVANLYNQGVEFDWIAFDADYPRKHTLLPTYPFETKPYWISPPTRVTPHAPEKAQSDSFFDDVMCSDQQAEDIYALTFDLDRHAYIGDHQISGMPIVPGACFVAMVLASQPQGQPIQITNFAFEDALSLDEHGAHVRMVVRKTQADQKHVTLFTPCDDRVIATGSVRVGPVLPSQAMDSPEYLPLPLEVYFSRLRDLSIDIGPQFQAFEALEASKSGHQVRARLKLPDRAVNRPGHLHPATIDAGFALMLAACGANLDTSGTFLPSGAGAITLHRLPGDSPLIATGHFTCAPNGRRAEGDIMITTQTGELILEVRGLIGVAAPVSALTQGKPAENLVTLAWRAEDTGGVTDGALHYVGDDVAFGRGTPMAALELAFSQDHLQIGVDLRGMSLSEGLQVVQTCVQHLETQPELQVTLITAGACSPVGRVEVDGLIEPDSAGFWGLAKVARLEMPEIQLRCVDLSLSPTAADVAVLLQAGQGDVAIRGARVYRPELQVLTPRMAAPIALKSDKAYVVTGASGAIAQTVMGWLLDNGARHIIAVSRSGTVSPEIVEKALTCGAELTCIGSDLLDPSFALPVGANNIAGVFHAAGVLHDATFAKTTAADLQAVGAPKTSGLTALLAHLDRNALDTLVLFSSAASLIGNPGQGAYSAANSVLDAMSRQLRQDGWPSTAISWGPWAGDGMAQQSTKTVERFERMGIQPLAADVALRGLGAAMQSDLAHLGCITCAWDTYAQAVGVVNGPRGYFSALLTPEVHSVPQNKQVSSNHAMIADLPEPERLARVTNDLAKIIADALSLGSLEDIDPDRPMSELGLDSLGNLEVRRALNDHFDQVFPIGMFFEYPTLQTLATFLDRLMFGSDRTALVIDSQPAKADPGNDIDIDAMDLDELADLVRGELDL